MDSVNDPIPSVEERVREMKRDPILAKNPDSLLRRFAEEELGIGPASMQRKPKPKRSFDELLARLGASGREDAPDDDPELGLELEPPPKPFIGSFEPRLIQLAREYGFDGYKPDNVPGGRETLNRLRKRLREWANDPNKRTQFVVIGGLEGRGKTRLMTLLAWAAVVAFKDWRPRWTAQAVRDSELRHELNNYRREDCGYDYGEDRPLTPVQTWCRRARRIVCIDEIGKGVVEYGRGDDWVRIWLEILTQLKESATPRLVIICTNIRLNELRDWERALPGGDKSAPVARRLTAHDVIQINLGGKDWSQEPPA